MLQFFVVYGNQGFKGAVLASLLFVIFAGILLCVAHNHKISNYQDLLNFVFGSKPAAVIDLLLAGFLFSGISIMLSASGAVFYEHLFLPKIMGILLAYMAILIALLSGKKGLITSYNYLVPVKILLLLAINFYLAIGMKNNFIATYTASLARSGSLYWVIAGVLYVAYNFTLAMVVLTEYQSITTRRQGVSGAMLGGLILGLLLILNFWSLANGIPQVFAYEVPMLFAAGKINPTAKYIYLLVLWLGILTTAIANTYGFTQRLARFSGLGFRPVLILTLTLALPLSWFSFSHLVGLIYPLFGIMGIIIINALICQYIKDIAG